jgi:hypothetical protein
MTQLKQKYQAMRKLMNNNIEQLKNKKKELTGTNVSLKSKYETLKTHEKDNFDKLMNLDQTSQSKIVTLENDYVIRNKERLELEANNRLLNVDLSNERLQHQELEFILKSQLEAEQMRQQEFDKEIALIENMINEKIKKFEDIEVKKVRCYVNLSVRLRPSLRMILISSKKPIIMSNTRLKRTSLKLILSISTILLNKWKLYMISSSKRRNM